MTISSASLNKYNVHAPVEGLGSVINGHKNIMKAVWDFEVDGGGVGTINLVDNEGNRAVLPAGAIITQSYADVVTTCTSDGLATISFHLDTAEDTIIDTDVASLTTGMLNGVALGTFATMFKIATAKQVKAVVATAAFTAGKINVFIEYSLSE